MGIAGLLPLLKSIQKPCNLKKFAGQTIGVDAYGWLHRGTVACAIDLALGKPTRKYVDFSMHRVRMLMHFGVTPYVVFDGDYLPSKASTEVERARRRDESKKRGLEFYENNKPSQAHLELQKAVDVTPAMAREFIEELKEAGIQYVVAPYEADAQLVYLEKKGVIQGMISEDSDLLVFGAKRLLTKLDQYGDCIEIARSDFTACREISLVGWTDAEFRRMAILSGCDYLASISGMGLKNAYRLVRKYKTPERILRMLQFDGKFHIRPGYLEAFHKAELTFLHQRVFCPIQNDIVMMTEPDNASHSDQLSFVGPKVDQPIAVAVARGDLDPVTKAPIVIPVSARRTPSSYASARSGTGIATPFSGVKGTQSLETYFKAQRTPLAELHPNSFTPSPTQAHLLRQAAGTTWESSRVAEETPVRREPATEISESLPTGSSNARISNSPASSMQPTAPKRRRLFEEPEGKVRVESIANDSEVRSRFFTASSIGPSSHSKSGKRPRRTKNTEIKIWSDDSVEEIMAELPDVSDQSAIARREKIKIFREDQRDSPEQASTVSSQNSESQMNGSETSLSTRTILPSISSAEAFSNSIRATPPSTAQILDKHVTAEVASLTGFYLPNSTQTISQTSTSSSAAGSMSKMQTELAAVSSHSRQQSMTPLQRLKASALNRSKSCIEFHSKATLNDSKDTAIVGTSVEKSSKAIPRLPLNRSIGPDASAQKGSEDFLIPDSEEDTSDETRTMNGRPEARLDLGHFAFTG